MLYVAKTCELLTAIDDTGRARECVEHRLCQHCGTELNGYGYGIPNSGAISGQALFHRPCLLEALQYCPVLSRRVRLGRSVEQENPTIEPLRILREALGTQYRFNSLFEITVRDNDWETIVNRNDPIEPQLRAYFTPVELGWIRPVINCENQGHGDNIDFWDRVKRVLSRTLDQIRHE